MTNRFLVGAIDDGLQCCTGVVDGVRAAVNQLAARPDHRTEL
jgi:hypothetical protein